MLKPADEEQTYFLRLHIDFHFGEWAIAGGSGAAGDFAEQNPRAHRDGRTRFREGGVFQSVQRQPGDHVSGGGASECACVAEAGGREAI